MWPENTKSYYLDPQMQLSFTNLVSAHVCIPVQAEQRVAVQLPGQRLDLPASTLHSQGQIEG